MALWEDIPPEMFTMFIPVMLGVVLIAVTVIVMFWCGAGKQRSFEEAKAQASKRAEEMLKGKEYQNSPRARKGKRQFSRKSKKTDDDSSSLSLDDTQPLKGILKPAATAVNEPTPERSPRNRVEFQLESPAKEDKTTPRSSPPTPHPVKQPHFKETLQQTPRTPQPLIEVPEEEEEEEAATVEPPKVKEEEPKKKPVTTTTSSKPGGGQKRSKSSKSKQQMEGLDSVEALPASRISEILSASSLSDEDIQQLFEVLLEKLTTNAEWQAADLKSESAKSLKKHNQELQSRCEQAEKTVQSHSSKIKELRSEIVSERARHQSSENALQGKILQQSNELTISKTRVSGLEEELKQLKAETTLRSLQEENNRLHTQMATLAQNASSSQQQLAAATKQLQELQDNHGDLKNELQRAREALKTSGVSQSQSERVAELESQLQSANYENENMKESMEEYVRLKTEVQMLKSANAKRDVLLQQNTALEEEKSRLLSEMDSLRQSIQVKQETAGTEVDIEKKVAEEVSAVKNELLSQHSSEMEGLKENIEQLEQAQSDKDREMEALKIQLERCSSLEEQLQKMSEQFTAEQTAKNELQGQLETLQSQTSNGPIDGTNGSDSINGDEKKTSSVSLEVHEQLLQSKDEELSKLRDEKDEQTEQYKMLEKKLDELKEKNNTLRDNCWKARDEAAEKEKAFETKLKASYQQMEQRCKQVKTDTLQEARDSQKSYLQQLFPTVTVESDTFSGWLDEFEKKVQEMQQQNSTQVPSLEEEVKELQGRIDQLQENEQKSVQEAEHFRQALEKTMSILTELQSSVVNQDTEHQKTITDKEEMIERERTTNRSLQQQLQKERDTTAHLQKQLQQKADSAKAEEKVAELEERLHDSEQHKETAEHEADSLRHSLNQELLMKEEALKKEEESTEKLKALEYQLKAEKVARESSEKKHKEKLSEVEQLRSKLESTEDMLEVMKESNRKLNIRINEIVPSTGGESAV